MTIRRISEDMFPNLPRPAIRLGRDTPYKGLVPYDEEDAEYFFGRDSLREIIIANLVASRLTLLYGPSGVGKSSVLRAGVAHHLRTLAERDIQKGKQPEFGFVVFNSWRDDPIQALEALVDEQQPAKTARKPGPTRKSSTKLFVDSLAAWTRRIESDVYLILDQFEEYFLYHRHERGENSFARQFVEAVNRPDLRVNFLISIREDSLAKLDFFKGRIPWLFNNYLRIDHLDREAATEAIEGPIRKHNLLYRKGEAPIEIEPELTEAVLDQVKAGRLTLGETGGGFVDSNATSDLIETPYLQLVMTRLWNEERSSGSNILRLTTLRTLGNAERIVRTHLDETMDSFTKEEQDIAASAFHYLVTPSGTKIAYYPADLAKYTSVPTYELEPVLNKLSTGKVLILRKVSAAADPNAPPRYEIFHDVLAKAVLDWRSRFTINRELLKNLLSDVEQRASKIRVGLTLIIMLVLAVMSLGILLYRKTIEATENKNRALALKLSVVAKANQGNDLSVLLAREAVKLSPAEDTETLLRDMLLKNQTLLVMPANYSMNSAVFSPDGMFAVMTSDERAQVWNLQARKKVGEIRGQTFINSAFSHDGKFVVSGGRGGGVQVWNAITGEVVHQWKTSGFPFEDVMDVEFSPDDKFVVTASNQMVRVWDLQNPREAKASLTHDQPVNSAEFSPDGNSIVTASKDPTARLWKWKDGAEPIRLGHREQVFTAKFSANGARIVTASQDGSAGVWNALNGQAIKNIKVTDHASVFDASFSPDGNKIATGDGEGKVAIWNADSGQRIASMEQRPGRVLSAVFSPDGTTVVSPYEDSVAVLWDAQTGRSISTLKGHTLGLNVAEFSPNGREILTAGKDHTARLWEPKLRDEILIRGMYDIDDAFISPAANLVFGRGVQGVDFVWDVRSNTELEKWRGSRPVSGSFSANEKALALVGPDGVTRIFQVAARTFGVPTTSPTARIISAAYSPNSKLLATGDEKGTIVIWEYPSGKNLKSFSGAKGAYCERFSPDGNLIGSVGADNHIRIWNFATGQLTHTLPQGSRVVDFAFTFDNRLAVTLAHQVSIYDLGTNKLVAEYRVPESDARSVSYNANSGFVMSVGDRIQICRLRGKNRCDDAFYPPWNFAVTAATFSENGRFMMLRMASYINIYPWERFAPLSSLLESVDYRVGRDLTAEEKEKYLNE